jgi:solute carrier family 27 fatty acid transporter 1/4
MFAQNVKKHPNKTCFYFEEEVWTFRDVSSSHIFGPIFIFKINIIFFYIYQIDEQSNRIANYFLSQGLQKGECVSVFMENRPMYVCIWLGLSKVYTQNKHFSVT